MGATRYRLRGLGGTVFGASMLACFGASAQPVVLFDRITPTSGDANALVQGRGPIACISVPWEGYAATIEFAVPRGGGALREVRVAYGGLPPIPPAAWTFRFMVWSSFSAATAGLPGSTAAMYNGDVATVAVSGVEAVSIPFGTHSFAGPIYDVRVDLTPFQIALEGDASYVLGVTVFVAGDVGVMETAQAGPPDRGLSPYYTQTGWRWMNIFPGLSTGRYAAALSMTRRCPADLNGDGVVDDSDFVIFAAAYNLLDCADPAMPVGCPADLNLDGLVDDADFVLFVVAYDALVCP